MVIAIMGILAALLFPAFLSARNSAKRTACASNLRQIHVGATLYSEDYDEKYMPIGYQPSLNATSRNDRTWVQLMLPYVRSFGLFRCPSDSSPRPQSDATFDQDLIPGDTYSQYYSASKRVDYGYNFQYFSPVVVRPTGSGIVTHSAMEVTDPSRTLLFVDSVWDRASNGAPVGGGSWLVVPPCRYYRAIGSSVTVDTFTDTTGKGPNVLTTSSGWQVNDSVSGLVFGGAWPWHNGRMNSIFLDGSVRFETPIQLTEGCDFRPDWNGYIRDLYVYQWNLH